MSTTTTTTTTTRRSRLPYPAEIDTAIIEAARAMPGESGRIAVDALRRLRVKSEAVYFPELYSVRITSPNGGVSMLSHRGRTKWSLRTARKHAREFNATPGSTAKVESH